MAKRFPGLGLERQRKVLATSFFQALLLREGQALADVAGDFPALSGLGIVDGAALAAFICQALTRPVPDCGKSGGRSIWRCGFGLKQEQAARATDNQGRAT